MTKRKHEDDLRGAARLAVAATTGITRVVEDMHRFIASGPAVMGRPLALPARVLTGLAYAPVRGVTDAVGVGLDRLLAGLGPWLGESAPGPSRDAALAALNGVIGDYLAETDNPLALGMDFRAGSRVLAPDREALARALPEATGRILLLVHGSSMNERQWTRKGHDHGAALARDLGVTSVYVRYNSGLHISQNGRMLADALEALLAAWPVPVASVSLLGHSMGGLVLRSACHVASSEGRSWTQQVRHLVCLGSPHHGAPLERAGNLFNGLLGISGYTAPLERLGHLRSAGVTDLRYGNVVDEDWQARGRFAWGPDGRRSVPLPPGVACFAIAGTTATSLSNELPGDGLVPVDSALGKRTRGESVAFPESNQWIALQTGHLDLLSSPLVYDKIREYLSREPPLGAT